MKTEDFLNVPNILKSLEDDKLIIFVGAGLSQSVGNPNWEDLVKQIVQHVATQTGKGIVNSYIEFLDEKEMTVLEVLEKLEGKYKREVVDGLVDTIIKGCKSEKHSKLFDISNKVITTNYDKMLEYNCPSIDSFTYTNKYYVNNLHTKNEFILKLHGTIGEPAECVLFKSQYDSIYREETGILFQMGNLIQHYTFLFIGFSFNDPYVKELFEKINRILDGYSNRHYMISTEISEDLANKSYLDVVKISTWDELIPLFDKLINIKNDLKKKKNLQ